MFSDSMGLGFLLVILVYLVGAVIAAVILYFVIRFAVGAAIRDNAETVARAVNAGINRSEGDATLPPV